MTRREQVLEVIRGVIMSQPNFSVPTEALCAQMADAVCKLDLDQHLVTLSPWERQQLSMHASASALTYASHKLFEHEKPVLANWMKLSEKLR